MPRLVASLLALVLTGTATIALASCGEEDAQLLPGETAREITANLGTVKRLADEGDCVGAESAALQVSEQVETIGGVDPELKRALRDGATRLNEVVASCEGEVEAATPDATTEVESPDTDKEAEKEEEKRDKDLEKEEKEREKEEEAEEEETQENEPPLPPQAKGEGKGLGDGGEEGSDGAEEGIPPSGGVSPGSPAEGE